MVTQFLVSDYQMSDRSMLNNMKILTQLSFMVLFLIIEWQTGLCLYAHATDSVVVSESMNFQNSYSACYVCPNN